jgi:hypothetical protein
VHGAKATDAEALRALDSGLAILSALERIPIQKNYVEVTCSPAALTGQAAGVRWSCSSFQVVAISRGVR